jgi:hypothetical protein
MILIFVKRFLCGKNISFMMDANNKTMKEGKNPDEMQTFSVKKILFLPPNKVRKSVRRIIIQ